MVKCTRAIATIVATLTLTLGGSALATEFGFKGSDTLFDVMTEAIRLYKIELAKGTCTTADCVKYLGTGSGSGENAMANHSATPYQRIAPMSRNLNSASQTKCETDTARTLSGAVGAGNCRAEPKNVLGLDAAVIVEGRGSFTSCPNIQPNTDPLDPTLAADNNILQLILGGTGGTGDWVACSSPARVQAIQTLRACNVGLGAFSRFYRRDNSSGTSDSVREKLKVQRFCSGVSSPAAGSINANLVGNDNDPIRALDCPPAIPGSRQPVKCTVTDPASTNYLKDCSSKRCTGGGTIDGVAYVAGFLACNADADCAALSARTSPAVNLGTCTAGLAPAEPGCTSGFVVALSEPDNASVSDITLTIEARILADNAAIGYAGREAIKKAPISGSPAFGPTINTNQSSDSNVRQDKYLMARRLWLHDTCNQNAGTVIPTCAAGATGPGCDRTDQAASAVNGRDAAECEFFGWATDELPNVSLKSGRENIDPIMKQFGFITCTDNFGQPTGDANLCSKSFGVSGFPAGAGAAAACTANGRSATGAGWLTTTCAGTAPCCSDGLACNNAAHAAGTCSVTTATACLTGADCPTGETCTPVATTFACPAPAKRVAGAACRFNSDCVSNSCDGFATDTTGACL